MKRPRQIITVGPLPGEGTSSQEVHTSPPAGRPPPLVHDARGTSRLITLIVVLLLLGALLACGAGAVLIAAIIR